MNYFISSAIYAFGGQVIIAADVFNKSNDQPAEILGKPGNLSLLPARLARIAGVPLHGRRSHITERRIDIQTGPLIDQHIPSYGYAAV